jgi:hypothetical protein
LRVNESNVEAAEEKARIEVMALLRETMPGIFKVR